MIDALRTCESPSNESKQQFHHVSLRGRTGVPGECAPFPARVISSDDPNESTGEIAVEPRSSQFNDNPSSNKHAVIQRADDDEPTSIE